jgi:uncharacterized protein YjbJ (UPF0337 family)
VQWEYVEKNWSYFDTKVKRNWNRLSDSDINDVAGNRERLIEKIMESYGCSREKAESEIEEFTRWIVGKGVTRYEIR